MKSLSELEAIRNKTLEDMNLRSNDNDYRIVVGMATCGIAAGAKPVLNAFIEEIKKRNVSNTKVQMTGCIGMCKLEPIVDVYSPDGSKVTYVNMNKEKVVRVVTEHIVNGKVVDEYLIGSDEL